MILGDGRTFLCHDSAGNPHTLRVCRQYIPRGGSGDLFESFVPGLWVIEDLTGGPVNRVERGRYVLLGPSPAIEVTSDDPDAP
jgi:hypothetical protein